ncbi:hypothetical protein AA103196_2919 [Ameyamaea chiangmaiensis NBRC 103196]|uniref:NYN domain-containing protein n=1 Tax=Ameyamaea chiangmaiensis TaxID=442969 RepID=A0A850P9B6_9PROT|nr:NYN domain-containing protein [Ameyamaea chiangmaiensis]MBS4074406.1 NYN domain-containing protein [Ameyamaea chiangmaiensis]NVN40488.1 NYN domain-containing protein [Ameyamaea chiangmaiensis]GBQ71920.1 hypothetical protein AA103196_2919 [Ameyamaea chiangmaiensis NBRC 103196]
MYFLSQDRTCVFIDGSSLYLTARNLGSDVDYRNLLAFFRRRCVLTRAYYYASLLDSDEYSPVRPLTDWLAYNGYALVTKPAREYNDGNGRKRIKGNMEVEIAVDMLEMAPRADHMVLFSGDGDLRRAVEAVQARGVRVSIISSLSTSPGVIADELRRQADQFIDLADILPDIARRPPDQRTRNHSPVRHPADDGRDRTEDR